MIHPLHKLRKTVRFCEDMKKTNTTYGNSCCDKDYLGRDLWYSREEMQQITDEAKSLVKSVRSSPDLSHSECTRGLEIRICFGRRERKQMIIKCIVKSQKKCSNHTQLACISHMCSTWSRMAARAQAKKDFYEAYNVPLTCEVPEMADFPLPLRSKKEPKLSEQGISMSRHTGKPVPVLVAPEQRGRSIV